MKVIIINLENRSDRLTKITENLNNLNIEFEKFDAICGDKLKDEEIKLNTTLLCRTILSNRGMIGCAMSHIKIWNSFVDSTEILIMISEDDIEYNSNFPDFLVDVDKIYKEIEFDMLSLNCSIGITGSLSDKKIIKCDNNEYKINKPIFPLTTASYIISRKGAIKLLKIIQTINYHIDYEIACASLKSKIDYYNVLNPVLLNVEQNSDTSTGSKNNGIMNFIFRSVGFNKLDWVLNNTAFAIFLDYSVTIYILLLIVFISLCLYKKYYILMIIFIIEIIIVILN